MRKEECRFARSISFCGSSSDDGSYCEEIVVWEELRLTSESAKDEDGVEEEGELRHILLRRSWAPLVGVSTEPGVVIGDAGGTIGRCGVLSRLCAETERRCGRGRICRSVVLVIVMTGTAEACSSSVSTTSSFAGCSFLFPNVSTVSILAVAARFLSYNGCEITCAFETLVKAAIPLTEERVAVVESTFLRFMDDILDMLIAAGTMLIS